MSESLIYVNNGQGDYFTKKEQRLLLGDLGGIMICKRDKDSNKVKVLVYLPFDKSTEDTENKILNLGNKMEDEDDTIFIKVLNNIKPNSLGSIYIEEW